MRQRRDPRADLQAMQPAASGRPRLDRAAPVARITGRLRRDPRAESAGLAVQLSPRLRIDRSGSGQRATAARAIAQRPVAMRQVPAPAFVVAVVPDAPGGRLTRHDRRLFGAAHVLAGKDGAVAAVIFGPVEGLGLAGADRVIIPGAVAGYAPDAKAALLARLQDDVRHMLFPESQDGGDLARRAAAITGVDAQFGIESVKRDSTARPARARRSEFVAAPAAVISVSPEATLPYSGLPCEALPLDLSMAEAGETAFAGTALLPFDPGSLPLAEADFVMAAGNGVTDLALFRATVKALKATPGASRVLVDAGLMPKSSQVGASGTVLEATCYLAFGIAGAPQHLQGIAKAEHVIAVNTDLHAAMIARAGLAIVADAQAVMAALVQLIAEEGK